MCGAAFFGTCGGSLDWVVALGISSGIKGGGAFTGHVLPSYLFGGAFLGADDGFAAATCCATGSAEDWSCVGNIIGGAFII